MSTPGSFTHNTEEFTQASDRIPTNTTTATAAAATAPVAPATAPTYVVQDIRTPRPFNGSSKNTLQIQSFLQSLEVQFALRGITSDYTRIYILAANLTDRALNWFIGYASNHNMTYLTYESFLQDFKAAFAGQIDNYDILVKLTNISQRNNVDGYVREFLQYSNLLAEGSLSQQTLVNLFIKGLKLELRKDIRLRQPQTLYDATEAAKILAHTISNDGGPAFSNLPTPSQPAVITSSVPQYPTDADGDVIMSIHRSHPHNPNSRRHSNNRRSSNNKKHSSSSINHSHNYYRDLYRRTCMKNGLCFKCGEPGHQSPACPASNPQRRA